MERGPLALFGAIVAVGLGPAMWLGAQLATVVAVPTSGTPAAVSSQRPPSATPTDDGGGAGAATNNPAIVLQPTDRGHDQPMRDARSVSPSPRPSRTSATSTVPPTRATTTPSPSSASPSTPPTEHTGTSAPPTGGSDAPPSPPPSTVDSNSGPTV